MKICKCKVCGRDMEIQREMEFMVCVHCGAVQKSAGMERIDIENLLKRGNMALEYARWKEADKIFEMILAEDESESYAYLGKLMAECRISNENGLQHFDSDIGENGNYAKACLFADTKLKRKLEEYRCQTAYNMGQRLCWSENVKDVRAALEKFESIRYWRDAGRWMETCRERIREITEFPRFYKRNQGSSSLIIQNKPRGQA